MKPITWSQTKAYKAFAKAFHLEDHLTPVEIQDILNEQPNNKNSPGV